MVKSDEFETLNFIETATKKGESVNEKVIAEWSEQGIAFPSTPEGIRLMHLTEEKKNRAIRGQIMRKPSPMKFNSVDMYINAGTERYSMLCCLLCLYSSLQDVYLSSSGIAYNNHSDILYA